MFSIPLGIMLHADVRNARSYPSPPELKYLFISPAAIRGGVHSKVRLRHSVVGGTTDDEVAWLLHRSFIAAYLGNIIGALFVALPAVYFYLRDYSAGGLVQAEAGALDGSGSSSPHHNELVKKE